ncbi:MAG: HupE/UreJ family protein [Pseudomonadota bacterium]
MIGNLRLVALVSSFLCWTATIVNAHEMQPAIADFEIRASEFVLNMEIDLEGYIAGIGITGEANDDNEEYNAEYEALRALSPEQLAARFPDMLGFLNAAPFVAIDGTPLTLETRDVRIFDTGETDFPRLSYVELAAPMPENAQNVLFIWPDVAGDIVIRQQGVDDPFTGFLSAGDSSGDVRLAGQEPRSGWSVFAEYIPVGFDHILPKGLDHILFVLGLFLFSTAWRPLLWQVTAFTAAHTVTLALGALGLVNVPGSIVEPLIALSIVYVAIENIFVRNLGAWRPAIIFGFGLLHGLGFASVLGEFGLPEAQFIPALLGFNVGVELGQLTVIAAAAALIWISVQAALRASLPAHEAAVEDYSVMFRAISIPGSLIIALIGAWWVIERTLL